MNSALDLKFCQSTTNTRPWLVDRYKLLSWWDMERFSGRAFYLVGQALTQVTASVERYARGDNDKSPDLSGIAPERVRKHVSTWISRIEGYCKSADLEFSCAHLERMLERMKREKTTYADVVNQIQELRQRISDEMRGQVFLFLPSKQAEFYDVREPFGNAVIVAFPSTAFDIREASTCYALERSTACVFHLMRVLEVALAALGKVFGLSLDHTNWGPAIEQIERKIREAHKDQLRTVMPDWKGQLEFYAQTVSYLGITKEAWRNYTAHARGKFTPEEAKQMFANVKLFMEQISRRLKE